MKHRLNRKSLRRQDRILSWSHYFLILFAFFFVCHPFHGVANGREIEATNEWTLLGENDTVAAGMHVRMDMTTGEKWVKLIEEEEESNSEAVDNTGSNSRSTGLAVAQVDADGNVETSEKEPAYDYEMMHRALSNLPPEEQERMGGIPLLPDPAESKITPEQRQAFEKRMKEIWEQRQAELKAFQEEYLADLPKVLKDRIAKISEYLEDPITQLQSLDLEQSQKNEEEGVIGDILGVLQDLEYHLTDVDMSRDFYTLGGWPLLSSLLADAVHENASNSTQQGTLSEEDWNKINLIQACAAWTIGTAVKNTGEFTPFATAQIDVPHKGIDEGKASVVKTTALDLVLAQFVASSKAILEIASPKNGFYDTVMMKVQKTLYAVGALLRANRSAQTHFCADQGPSLLAKILSAMADQAQSNNSISGDNTKVVQRLLSLAQDIVMDVTLHGSKTEQVDLAIGKAFTTPDWCDAVKRFLPIPRLYETSLLTIQQLAPHCSGSWDKQEVQRSVKEPPSEVLKSWLPDDLDEELREERMSLVETTLQAVETGSALGV